MSVAMALLGAAMIVRTLAAGGGPIAIGVVLGALLMGAGAGRLYLQRRAGRSAEP